MIRKVLGLRWRRARDLAHFVGRVALLLYAVIPYLLVLLAIPGALNLFRVEIDWIGPCEERLRAVQTQLAVGSWAPNAPPVCPVTGARYVVKRKGSAVEVLCPGIHRRMTVVWIGVRQGYAWGSAVVSTPGVRIKERVRLHADAKGQIRHLDLDY